MATGLSDTAGTTDSEPMLGGHCYLSEDEPSPPLRRMERHRVRGRRRILRQGLTRRCRSFWTLYFDYGAVFVFLGAFNTLSQSSVGGLDQSAQLLLLINLPTGLVLGFVFAQLHVACRRLRGSN
jgi:hypothetical protein